MMCSREGLSIIAIAGIGLARLGFPLRQSNPDMRWIYSSRRNDTKNSQFDAISHLICMVASGSISDGDDMPCDRCHNSEDDSEVKHICSG